MTVARCCVQERDWKSSMHSREDTEWGSMCWMVLGDVAMPKMNINGRRWTYRLWDRDHVCEVTEKNQNRIILTRFLTR